MKLSRREFARLSGLAVGGLSLSSNLSWAFPQAVEPRHTSGKRVVILGAGLAGLAHDLEAYVIDNFVHLMTEIERRVLMYLKQPLTHLRDAIALEEARGRVIDIDEKLKSFLRSLQDDPEVLRLAQGGSKAFYARTAKRILSEDRDKIFINNCPSCGVLARTPKSLFCRVCGHGWHRTPANHT